KNETPRDDQPLLDRPRPSKMNLKERLRQLLDSMDDGEIGNRDDTFSRPRHLPKLPPIKLLRFSGKESEWQAFIELFTSVIHDNSTLSGVQKMQYLISNLEATPKKLISHLALTNANYESAMEILKARYENKRLMVNNYMSSIVQHRRLTAASADEVIQLHDCINACIAGLKNLGYNVTTWDPMLVSIAMQKFDGETNKAFEESIIDVTAVPTIAELMKFLLKRYRILRASPKEAQYSKELKKKSFHTASSLQVTCSKCGNDHILMKCPEFQKLTPLQRKDHAKEKNLCYNCLTHHRKDDCKSKKTCFTCNKRHHTLLHFEQKKPTNKKSLHTSVPNESDAESTEDAPVAFHTKTSSLVLSTAEIRIRDKAGQWQHFRALLDTGSGDTFISESAAQTLKLPRQKTATSIKGIGDVKAAVSKTTMDITIAPRFSSQLKWCTTALVLPKLSSFLPSRPIRSECPTNVKSPA
ncbi:uncharacterized protein LOC132261397, partial [Phlebotomus argentipes]|uniref:uncharacterized protein LOC132261397 n=1 Tax=Phlebotomus argentipes TaxID=94469 RepID=UPI002892FC2A